MEKLERVGESMGVEVIVVGLNKKSVKVNTTNKCDLLVKSLGSWAWVLRFKTWS